MLRVILNEKNQSLYQLEKASHVSHATLNDIYNERCNIDNCSISILNKIAKSLDMSIDSLYKYLSYDDLSLIKYDDDFDLFKSNTLQDLKRTGEKSFVDRIEKENEIVNLFSNKEYAKSLYLLSLVDYLSEKNHVDLNQKYEYMRENSLDKMYVPKSIYLLLATKTIKISDVYKESIKTFLNHNIMEAELDNVI